MELWGYNKNVQKALNKVLSTRQILNTNTIIVEIPPCPCHPHPFTQEKVERERERGASVSFVSDLIICIFLCAKEINTITNKY